MAQTLTDEPPTDATKEAVVRVSHRDIQVPVGIPDVECPSCGRKSFRVYEPGFRALTLCTGFLPDGFLARCRHADCAFSVHDFHEHHPSGGWYGPREPASDDLLFVPAHLGSDRSGVILEQCPVRLGDYARETALLVTDQDDVEGRAADDHLAQLAREAHDGGCLLFVAPAVVRAGSPTPPGDAEPPSRLHSMMKCGPSR